MLSSEEHYPNLSPGALKVWQAVYPKLADRMDPAQFDLLVVYCEAVSVHRLAALAIERDGLTVPGSRGRMIRNPACSIMASAAQTMRQYARMLALHRMTPATKPKSNRLDRFRLVRVPK